MSKPLPPLDPELDPSTRQALQNGLSRRSFLATTAAGAAGAAVLGMTSVPALAAVPEAPKGRKAPGTPAPGTEFAHSSDGGATLQFMPKPKAIPEKAIVATHTCDVVVVGAGASGVCAALSAQEAGAKVIVLQKAPFAVSQGNTGTGLDLDGCDKAGVEALVARIIGDNNHRSNPKLVRQWAYNSGQAVKWVIDRAKKGGSPVIDQGNLQHGPNLKVNGYKMNYITSFFGPKPYTTGDGMRHLAAYAEKQGVKFFYRHPAMSLVQSPAGAVIGVIAQDPQGKYVRFMAKKGVILATGDYQSNKAMSDYFLPDLRNLGRKQMDRDGDGFVLAYWAGGVIEPIGHTKMLHDFDAGPATMCDMPFLAVDRKGKRFVSECVDMSLLNNYLKSEEDAGHYCQIFDADYMTRAAKWPGRLVPPEGLKNYMPGVPGPKKGVLEPFINTHVADTLEELARKLEIDPANLVATVKRYNELAAAGRDEDFGNPAEKMAPVLKAPFYGIHRTVRVSAITSGMVVNENHNALAADGKPIKGLYVVGNLSGGFYGGIDYPLTVPGLSLGRCYTIGYLTGKHVASL
ncbi:MAG TPA: FAD-binding protein [Holophaga sp.]|nr:FAD-binding protein [Holophaga sp.]